VADVFRYLDVQAYLAAEYDERKARGRGFSYRAFSRRAGLRSPNHLKRVIDGERTLTPQMAVRYADALGLEGDAKEYFRDLAAFGRARTSKQREAAYQRLLGYRRVRSAHRLEAAQADYHSRWYLPALRELISLEGAEDDPHWLAAHLVPSIPVADVRKGLETLETLGLIEKDDGRWVQGQRVVTTGAETRNLHVASFHRAMLERAAGSIDLVPNDQRDISSLTFTCSDDTFAEVKRRIVAFRKELIALLADDADEDRVAQLNIQLFPLSRWSDE
jgi:uncharacterized protein (TIGR02147 family)